MENKQYKLSIVALVYNLEKYLPRCLDALVNQTLEDIEILCVNDGSTDSAPQIIEEYARKYPNKVKVFHKENGGEFTTRNYGLDRATGEYVTFVDTDDYVEHDWAEKLYNAAKEYDADMAVCGFERIDLETDQVVARDMVGFGNVCKKITPDDDFMVFINPAPWNKIYKTEVIRECVFPEDIAIGEDTIFLMELLKYCQRIGFLSKSLLFYRQRAGSAMHGDVRPQLWDNIRSGNAVYDIAMSYSSSLRDAAEYRFVENISNILWKIKYRTDIKNIQKTYYKEFVEMKIAIRKRYRLGSKNCYILKRKRQYLNIAYFSPFLLLRLFRFVNFIKRRQ